VKISDDNSDHVDLVRREWAAERPELDTSPIEVVARIGRLAHLLDRAVDATLARHGLRRDAFDVLAALRRSGPPYELSPTELYGRLMRTSGAVTNRLHRLQDADLVRRIRDPGDDRRLLVALTAEGRRKVDEAAPDHLENERALLAALTPSEQDQLAALLRKLLLALERP
jgi:DNA-binding MarR family transcriptional regulator